MVKATSSTVKSSSRFLHGGFILMARACRWKMNMEVV